MSYPYGPVVVPPALPDLPFTILQRRQGDVKATLIQISLNNQPVNLNGFTFTFSVSVPGGLQTVSWTVDAPSSGIAITTVDGSGFTIPSFGSSVNVTFVDATMMAAGDLISITGAGIYSVQSVTSTTTAVILNTGLAGNISYGTILNGTPVYEAGQMGATVLVIPSSITDNPTGLYPCYCKYRTADPSPGPYVVTFLQGDLQLLNQNDPNG